KSWAIAASAFTLAAPGSTLPFVINSSAYPTCTVGSQASNSASVIGRSVTLTTPNSKAAPHALLGQRAGMSPERGLVARLLNRERLSLGSACVANRPYWGTGTPRRRQSVEPITE